MTIKKQVKPAAVDAFVSGAPDANAAIKTAPTGVIRGKKKIITVGFTPDLLEKIDAGAAAIGVSRAAFISMACSKATQENI